MREPYIVLERYAPTVLDAKRIGEEILAITQAAGLKPYPEGYPWPGAQWRDFVALAEVRGPKIPDGDSDAMEWHQDGNKDWGLILWSSAYRTSQF
jgi:hypothetical protein